MSNSTNNLTYANEQQSVKDLYAQLTVNVVLFFVALSSTLSNLVVLFALYKGGNSFRSHHYKLVIQMTAVAFVQSLFVFLVMGVTRLIDTALRIPVNMTVKDCGLLLLFLEATVAIDPCNVLMVSIDRLVAVAFPFHYKNLNLSKIYKIGTFAAPWIFGLADAASKFFLWNNVFMGNNVSVCIAANTRTADYANWKYYRGLLIGGTTIFFYLLGIVIVKYKTATNTVNSKQLKKELGFKLIVTCGADAFVYSCTFFLSQIYQAILIVNATPAERNTVAPIALMFILLATIPRFYINYFLNKDLKKVVKQCIWGQRQSTIGSTSKVPTIIAL